MNELLEILKELHPDVDYENCTTLIDDKILDSFDIVSIISEVSDAISVVVSEETGRVSIAMDGELNYNLTLEYARMMLIESLQPKKETFFDAESNLPEEMEEVNDEQKEQN